MTNETKHICVCVCTFKRPQYLKRLIDALGTQDTDGLFTYSVVVADNDHLESARAMVLACAGASPIPIKYCVEPRQNIALARNKAVENAQGDFVAFIDDDEFPSKNWLLTAFKTCAQYGVDGVLGPVKPYFDEEPPQWIVKGKFYERATYATGSKVEWRMGRTNNFLVRRELFATEPQPFRPEFRSGEDQDFTRRMIEKGRVFIWCNEAVAYEVVAPVRWKRTFMLRRALLRGATTRFDPTLGALSIAKSILAVPVYAAALPLALVLGHHRFMNLLVRLCDHLGKLLACAGINPVKEPYVTE